MFVPEWGGYSEVQTTEYRTKNYIMLLYGYQQDLSEAMKLLNNYIKGSEKIGT